MKKLICSNCDEVVENLTVSEQKGVLSCPHCNDVVVEGKNITKSNVNVIAPYIAEIGRESFLNKFGFQKIKKSWAHTGALILFAPLILFSLFAIIFLEEHNLFEIFYYSLGPIGMGGIVIIYYLQGKKPKYKKV
jgi:hypothetical protein